MKQGHTNLWSSRDSINDIILSWQKAVRCFSLAPYLACFKTFLPLFLEFIKNLFWSISSSLNKRCDKWDVMEPYRCFCMQLSYDGTTRAVCMYWCMKEVLTHGNGKWNTVKKMRNGRRELWVYLWQIRKDFCGTSRSPVAPDLLHGVKYDIYS